jgi:GDP-L-fucose synthase
LELANLVKDTTGFVGAITHDLTKEDGTPVKRLDVSLLDNLGWESKISLEEGIKSTYGDFLRCEENNSLRI